jgi:hypothetical protein
MKARDNPFEVQRVLRARYRLQGLSWDELLSRLEKLQYRAAIVGPEGSGKTTLLEDLESRLQHRGFEIVRLRLSREKRHFSAQDLEKLRDVSTRYVVLFDGAEQLSRWKWEIFKRQSRRFGGLIITSHKMGMLPTLLHCQTSPQLLDELIQQIAPDHAPDLKGKTAALFHKHDGNLRNCLRELYDVYANKEPDEIISA